MKNHIKLIGQCSGPSENIYTNFAQDLFNGIPSESFVQVLCIFLLQDQLHKHSLLDVQRKKMLLFWMYSPLSKRN